MADQIIETILAQTIDELNELNQGIGQQKQLLQIVLEKLDSFEQKLQVEPKITTPAIDLRPLEASIANSMSKLETTIENQPKSVIKKHIIQLFPEQNAREYYRLVFGRLLFWMMIFIGATYLFVLGKQGLENCKEESEKQWENDQYKKAFDYLYAHESKDGKGKMKSVLLDATKKK